MASRGETTGPRVDEVKSALSNWRLYTFLTTEFGYSAAAADEAVDRGTLTPGGPQ